MAYDLGDLGNSVGKVYQRLKSGAINTVNNTPANVMLLMNDANKSRLIYTKYTEATGGSFTDQFQDDTWGTRYYLNAEVAAPSGDITGALDVTKYFIAPTKAYKDQVTIDVDDQVTIVRYSFNHVVLLSPASGTEDILNYMNHDLQPGDLVFFTLTDDSTDTITIQPHTVDAGNFKCQNGQAIVLSGPGSCALFIRDGSSAQLAGGKGFLREIGRPNQQALGIANKTLTAGGGNYYPLDISTPTAARIDTKNGLVVLQGGATLGAPWTIYGEMVDSARSEGTTLDIILDSPLITDRGNYKGLTIFGIEIPDLYCKNYNFVVRAWYNDGVWEAKMLVDELKDGWIPLFSTGASGEEYVFGNPNETYVDPLSTATALKTLSHVELTEGRVQFSGYVVLASPAVYAATGVISLATDMVAAWSPNYLTTGYNAYAICPVYDPADLGAVHKFCTVYVQGNALYLSTFQNYDLAVGEYIDISPLSYIV